MADEPNTELEAATATVRDWIDEAQRIVVLTGAGISTESGIPDFRGPQGVWTKNPAAEKMATIQNFMADTEVRQRSWQHRLEPSNWRAEPNAGHAALVELERRGKLHTLVTQNVDGLHQKAGTSEDRMVEIHGTMQQFICMRCEQRGPIQIVLDRVRAGDLDPACDDCGGIIKTATISFGQALVEADLSRAFAAANDCDLMLAIGSTLAVFPIAGIVPEAHQNGARIVILNAEPTEMDVIANATLRGQIGQVLPQLVTPRTGPELNS
jgi:NAD-dependent deacetylase